MYGEYVKICCLMTHWHSSVVLSSFHLITGHRGNDILQLKLNRVEFIQLALEEKPLNLGQGFPGWFSWQFDSYNQRELTSDLFFPLFTDFAAPEHVAKALSDATLSTTNVLLNQYTRGFVSFFAFPSSSWSGLIFISSFSFDSNIKYFLTTISTNVPGYRDIQDWLTRCPPFTLG